jgi:hypothetical protein
MDIIKDPYLDRLRSAVSELKRLVDGEPTETSVTHAWASFDKIKDTLGHLCPNHPEILRHR